MKKRIFTITLLTFIVLFTGCNEDSITFSEEISLESLKAGNDNPKTDPADANYFDLTGNLCIKNFGYQPEGTPLELWMGVGNQDAGTKVGEVTFIGNCVRIDLTRGEGIYDLTAIHMDFVNDYDEFPTNKPGNPKAGHFEYNYDSSEKLNSVRIAPSVYEICGIALSGYNLGAIHVDAIPGEGSSGVSSVEDFENLLPEGLVTMRVEDYVNEPNLSYFKLNIGENGGIIAGECEAWCIDPDRSITRSSTYNYSANIYSSYETLPSEITGSGNIEYPENLDLVNYLLNNFAVGDEVQLMNEDCSSSDASDITKILTSGDIQRAIWYFMDDDMIYSSTIGPWDQKRINAIICDVELNGDGFIPGCDDYIVFIAIPLNNVGGFDQPVICKIPMSCESGIGSGTAWADGKYGIGFLGNQWATYFGIGCD